MTHLLLDINLTQLPDEYLSGEWRVADRVLNQTQPDHMLAQATRFVLGKDQLLLDAPPTQATGRWTVQRDLLMNRPYLELTVNEEVTRALVTRLRRSSDGLQCQLNLYFQTGMEMQLARP